jgi:Lysylphosphatidylglycerol synthase TM region
MTPTPTELQDTSHEAAAGPGRPTNDVREDGSDRLTADLAGIRRRWRGRLAMRILATLVLLSTVSVLFVELRHTDLRATFAHTQWFYVGLAVVSIAASVVAAAYNLLGFTPLRLRLAPTLLAQLAVSAIRVVTPSAVSTPAIATRYLTQSGATTPDALASVGVAQTVQLVVTTALVGGFGVVSGWGELHGVGRVQLSLWLAGGLLVVLAGWLAVRLSARTARLVRQAALARHAKRRRARW